MGKQNLLNVRTIKDYKLEVGQKYSLTKVVRNTNKVTIGKCVGNYERMVVIKTKHGYLTSILKADIFTGEYEVKQIN